MLNEMDKRLIQLLSAGASVSTMKKNTGLYEYQIAARLKKLRNLGYQISRQLKNKDLLFKLEKDIVNNSMKDKVDIKVNNYFRFLVLSDTHVCGIYERLDLLKNAYDYAETNKINHCFQIDSAHKFSPEEQFLIPNTEDQIKYLIKNYPKRNNIITSVILGNHDYYSVQDEGLDISRMIEDKRLDIVTLGYVSSSIKINNRYIVLHHPFDFHNKKMRADQNLLREYEKINPDIIFTGHLHKTGIYQEEDKKVLVNVPAMISHEKNYPSAFDCILISSNSTSDLDILIIKPLMLEPKVIPVTEIKYDLPKKVLTREMNQIEKFNAKYNK